MYPSDPFIIIEIILASFKFYENKNDSDKTGGLANF
jgi:hypothetical protein